MASVDVLQRKARGLELERIGLGSGSISEQFTCTLHAPSFCLWNRPNKTTYMPEKILGWKQTPTVPISRGSWKPHLLQFKGQSIRFRKSMVKVQGFQWGWSHLWERLKLSGMCLIITQTEDNTWQLVGRRQPLLDIQQYTRQSTNDLPHRPLNDPPDIHTEKKNLFVRAWDLNPFYM